MSQQEPKPEQQQMGLEKIAEDRGIAASSTSNPGQISDTLQRAMRQAHLVSPSTTCPNLMIGTQVAFSSVLIDVDHETYPIPGSKKVGISKVGLDRISKGVGIVWDPIQSHRTDDGRDPFFASFRAVGHYFAFDGSPQIVIGEKQMDLRDGSESAKTMSAGNLSQTRKFIAEHAETKARLRAIRSLGIQTAYDPDELKKPFVTARLMIATISHEDDPTGELRKIQVEGITQRMLGGSTTLFGSGPREIAPPAEVPAQADEEPETKETPAEAKAAVETKVDPLSTECVPGKCLKIGSTKHIPECFGETAKAEPEQATFPTEQAEVKDAVLSALSSQLDNIISQLERDGLSDAEAAKLKRDQKQIEEAIEVRRKALK